MRGVKAPLIVQLGTGVKTLPPGNEAGAIEATTFYLSKSLSSLGLRVVLVDVERPELPESVREVNRILVKGMPLPTRVSARSLTSLHTFLLLRLHSFVFCIQSMLVLLKLSTRNELVIAHSHTGYVAVTTAIVSKLTRGKVLSVFSSHFAGFMGSGYLGTLTARNTIFSFSEIAGIKLANLTIADTPTIARNISRLFHLGQARVASVILGVGFDEGIVAEVKRSVSTRPKTILCVGAIHQGKNQLTLVKCIPRILSKFPNAKFVFAGPIRDYGYFDQILHYVEKKRLESSAAFLGVVSLDVLLRLYASADVFALPTTAESQCIVILEALSFGVPVVTSKLGPILDLLGSHRGCARLTDPFDESAIAENIEEILGDATTRSLMSEATQSVVEEHGYERMAREVVQAYKSLLSDRHPQTNRAVDFG